MKMYRTAIALTLLCCASGAWAETVRVPAGMQGASHQSIPRPARGLTMDDVTRQFGEPVQRHAAVGEPPIARWDYAHYTVYFERQYVIHSVLHADTQ